MRKTEGVGRESMQIESILSKNERYRAIRKCINRYADSPNHQVVYYEGEDICYIRDASDDEEKDRAKIEKLLRDGTISSSEEYYLLYRRDVYLLADKSDLMQLIRFLIYDKGFEPDDFSLNFVEYLSYDDGGVLLYTFKSVNKELYVSIGEDGVDSFGYLAWDKESSCMELFSIDNARVALERGFPEGFDYDNDEVISWAKSRDDCPDVIDQIEYNKLKKMYEETND